MLIHVRKPLDQQKVSVERGSNPWENESTPPVFTQQKEAPLSSTFQLLLPNNVRRCVVLNSDNLSYLNPVGSLWPFRQLLSLSWRPALFSQQLALWLPVGELPNLENEDVAVSI